MNQKTLTPAIALVGATLMVGTGTAAAENPFAATPLAGGYMQLAEAEGKCGEGKCGGAKDEEGKCGGAKDTEGKCGEGKCGEGKCGGEQGGSST